MKKILIGVLILLFTSTSVFSFNIPKMGGKDKKPAVSLEDALVAQKDLVGAYVAGNKYDLVTKAILADALGLKDEAAELKTASESINEGNAKDISATQAKTENAQKAIEAKMDASKELSADAKKKVGASFLSLTAAVISYKKAVELSAGALDSAKSVVKNASMTDALSIKKQLSDVLEIAPQVPGDLSSIASTATKYIQFAKSAGVKPPSDLTSALGDL